MKSFEGKCGTRVEISAIVLGLQVVMDDPTHGRLPGEEYVKWNLSSLSFFPWP